MRLKYKGAYIVIVNLDDFSDFKVNLNIEKYSEFLINSGNKKTEVIKAFSFINNLKEAYDRYMKCKAHTNQGFKEYISITLELIANYFNLDFDI